MKLTELWLPLSFALVVGTFSIAYPNAAYSTTTSSCSATLDGSQEVPPVETDGNGTAAIEFDPASNELSWSINFTGLSGPAISAHFHGPAAPGASAGPLVNIADLDSPIEGSAVLTSEQATWLLDGQLYVNVHTAANPNGEIRGWVSCESAPGPGPMEMTRVTVGGEEFEIEYSIFGGTLDEVAADASTQTLSIGISSTSDGNLTLWLPTDLIDSEDDFAVFIDGEFGSFVVDELEPTDNARVLLIEFEQGAEEIEIIGTSMAGGEPELNTVSVVIGARTYDIEYEITGGTVDSATADVNSTSLLFEISTNGSGTLTLWLPTRVIDAENSFTVSADGSPATFEELEPTASSRVLQIDFEDGTEEIEVMGTMIVPEFSSMAILVASLATVGAIIAARRSGIFGRLR